ncbi:MAG TPA: hypothetical protein VIK55_15300, partial [Paludibacter sp.]
IRRYCSTTRCCVEHKYGYCRCRQKYNDRGYAHLRFAGASLSQSDKVNAGANTAKCMSTNR